MKRPRRIVVGVAIAGSLVPASPAAAASTGASCIGAQADRAACPEE